MKHEPVQHLFDRMAQRMPEQVAISCGETRITYRELQQRTDKLTHLLNSSGAKKDTIVAILLDNKVDAITSIIAVLKAGAVFVPFDPLLPELRLETMVREVAPELFISTTVVAPSFSTSRMRSTWCSGSGPMMKLSRRSSSESCRSPSSYIAFGSCQSSV